MDRLRLLGLRLGALVELAIGLLDDRLHGRLVGVPAGQRGHLLVAQRAEDRDLVRAEPGQRLVLRQAAVLGALEGGVRAAAAGRHDRHAAAVGGLLALVLDVLLLLGELGLGGDVDLPPGQPSGEAGVLTVAPDRQRELVVGDDHGRLLRLVVNEHLAHARRRERLGDEPGGLVVVGDDVDLLAAQLRYDHAHAGAARADAGSDRIHAIGVRDDGDLRAPARLTGDAGDLHELVGDLGDLELEELLDQLGIATGDDDARALGVGRDVGDHRLDAHAVVVALVVDLLGARQQRLDALAELDQRVAVVGLLDDPGD